MTADDFGGGGHSSRSRVWVYFSRARHDSWVLDGPADGDVSVETNGAQVEDGRRAQPDVDRQPDTTPHRAERPVAKHLRNKYVTKNHRSSQLYTVLSE